MVATIQTRIQLSIHMYIHDKAYDAVHPGRSHALPVTQAHTADSVDLHLGRKTAISREDLLAATLRLIGPHRSVSSLSLREVAREAGIAPNSFYRQFRDIDELGTDRPDRHTGGREVLEELLEPESGKGR